MQTFAQNQAPPGESAQVLRDNGQIYLVVLVLLTIFAGILFLLIRMERKLSKMEKNF
jgi:preprotein translocase subunit YajC